MKRSAHPNSEAHAKLMAWLDRATPEEVMALSIKAGIHDESGNLTPNYRSEETYFISGHLDITSDEFARHYAPRIESAIANGAKFVVGDAPGCDALAQAYLSRSRSRCVDVVVYHMCDKPRHYCGGWLREGGYTSDAERDAAMTAASTDDIAWVRPGREKSGTAKNLKRRAGTND